MKTSEAEKYLNSFNDYEKTTGYSYNTAYFNLQRMDRLLELLDSPHKKVPSIHITGTKGKGSTAGYIASILIACGLKTGLYTSPHILTFRERIKINAKMISWAELDALVCVVKPAVEMLQKEGVFGQPTFFEVYTALSFLYFAKKKVDIMVLEVGMGGRLDATNVVTPLVSVMTPISLDHVKELGGTLSKIAVEKAGIIKKGVPVVTAPQEKQVLAVLEEKARLLGSKFLLFGNDFSRKITAVTQQGVVFDYKGLKVNLNNIRTRMTGRHQALNASIALAAVEVAAPALGLTVSIIKKKTPAAVSRMLLPGRVQLAGKSPFLIFDAAHNTASAKTLLSALSLFKFNKLIMVIGMSGNKDFKGFLKVFEKKADKVIYVKAANYRSAEPKDLFRASNILKSKALVFSSVALGFNKARKFAKVEDLICVTGSFYVLHDVFKVLKLKI